MTGIDPAEVAAQIVHACVSDGCGNCIEHDYNTIWDNGICELFDSTTEAIRAALEQAWDEGYDTGYNDRPNRDTTKPMPVNPYAKGGKS